MKQVDFLMTFLGCLWYYATACLILVKVINSEDRPIDFILFIKAMILSLLWPMSVFFFLLMYDIPKEEN